MKSKESSIRAAKRTFPSFDSIASCAAALGLDKSILQEAKREGSPGFRGSRVYPLEVLPWILKRNTAGRPTRESIQLRRKEHNLSEDIFEAECRRKLWRRQEECEKDALEVATTFVRIIDAIPTAVAPDLIGQTEIAKVEQRLKLAVEDAKRVLHEWCKSRSKPQ